MGLPLRAAHVELAGIVQVFGAQAGVCIELWPAGETARSCVMWLGPDHTADASGATVPQEVVAVLAGSLHVPPETLSAGQSIMAERLTVRECGLPRRVFA